MTWGRLQSLVSALAIGDSVLTSKPNERIALLEYALFEISQIAEVLTLEVSGHVANAAREGFNDINLRKPTLPVDDDSELDIDDDLCFAAARLIVSYISREKFVYHRKEALDMIKKYNDKIERYRRIRSSETVNGEHVYVNENKYYE